MNSLPWTGSDRPPGEEYVPPDYVPRHLTATLLAARTALFGPGADRAGTNLTLARLLAYLHASPLVKGITAADSRISYDPARPVRSFDSAGPVVTGPAFVGWDGSPAFPAAGRAHGAWTVATDGAGNYTVIPAGSGSPVTGGVDPLAAGDAVQLPGSSLRLVVPTNGDGVWVVTLLARPAHSFTVLADLPDLAPLFRPSAGGNESLWFSTWSGTGPVALRAGAAALALAERVLELGA